MSAELLENGHYSVKDGNDTVEFWIEHDGIYVTRFTPRGKDYGTFRSHPSKPLPLHDVIDVAEKQGRLKL